MEIHSIVAWIQLIQLCFSFLPSIGRGVFDDFRLGCSCLHALLMGLQHIINVQMSSPPHNQLQ
jgi:hypothetical protein